MFTSIGACLLALASTALAVPTKFPHEGRALLELRDSTCTNGPSTRQCWNNGYSVSANIDSKTPNTGVTRTYTLSVAEGTLSPDGVDRQMMLVNGQYPGPTIEADWGDTIQVTVSNNLKTNGTSIHWHGIRQLGTNVMDGTNGLTECPIPPGSSKTYTFKAAAYGTSWYHSHYSAQYADGVVGGIVIHGPATANYDIDLGFYPLTDYFRTPFFTVAAAAAHAAGPPPADNILINGSMKTTDESSGGNYAVTTLQPGKKHLLRLANVGINNYIHVGLDGHKMTIVGSDFNAVQPSTVDSIVMGVGQRYDVIIEANANSTGSFWFRAGPGDGTPTQGACDGPNANAVAGNTKAIFKYAGAADGNPTSTPSVALTTGCHDQPDMVPYYSRTLSTNTPGEIDVSFSNINGTVQWLVDGSAIQVDFEKPTLSYVADGTTPPPHYNVLSINGGATNYVYWHIQWVAPTDGSPNALLPHPIHLHGHDFYVVGQGDGTYAGQALNLNNPPRRDTATLPAGGYLILGFPTDNPGVWLMHCHIPFHVSGGLAKQFLENTDQIDKSSLSSINGQCSAWKTWQDAQNPTFTIGDSGL